MTSTTITIKNAHAIRQNDHVNHYNWYSIMSCLCACLFVGYLLLPLTNIVPGSSSLMLTFFGVVVLPLAAFVLSIISFKSHSHEELQGTTMVPSYIALSITSLYFMTALAIPLILIGSYILYTYIF